jgi:hypothetical protein
VNAVIAAAAAIAVVLSLVTAVLGLVNQRRAAHALTVADSTAGKVESISVQVDGRLSKLLERQSQLLDALHAADVPVPPRPPEAPEHAS